MRSGLDLGGRAILLNGGSSSGKTTLARCLQAILPGHWLRLGVDTLIDAVPAGLLQGGEGLALDADGAVTVGPAFAVLERYWMRGVAAIVSAGGQVIIEDNFVSGPVGQQRWREALADLPTFWVGVRADAAVAEQREQARDDRVTGMAAAQAELVHRGIRYDFVVDTSRAPAEALAVQIRDRLGDFRDQKAAALTCRGERGLNLQRLAAAITADSSGTSSGSARGPVRPGAPR